MRASAARSAWRISLSVASGRKTTSAFAVAAPVGVPRVRYSAGRRRDEPGRRQDQHEHGLNAEGERQPAHGPAAGARLRTAASVFGSHRGGRAGRASRGRPTPGGICGGSAARRRWNSTSAWQRGHCAEVRLEAGPFLRIERGVGVPRQQDLRRQVLVAVEMEDAGLHSQSSGSPDSSARSRRRPWKTRVFTVSTGQPTITRDLGVGQVVEVGEDENAALLVREAVERPRQRGPGLLGRAMLLRPGARRGAAIGVRRLDRLVVIAQRLQRRPIGDGEHPGRYLALAVEGRGAVPDHEHGVVQHLLDDRPARRHQADEAMQPGVIAAIERLEGGELARASPGGSGPRPRPRCFAGDPAAPHVRSASVRSMASSSFGG